MKGYIYQYTFPDGKIYIGQTRRPIEMRHREHLNPSTGILNPGFWEAYQSVGEPSLKILETIETEDVNSLVEILNEKETAYIILNNATDPRYGYNRKTIATSPSPDKTILKKELSRLYNQASLDIRPFFSSIKRKIIIGNFKFSDEEKAFICDNLLDNNLFSDTLREQMNLDDYSLKDGVDSFFLEEAMEFAEMVYLDETYDTIVRYVAENAEEILRNTKQDKIIQQLDKDGNIIREYWSTAQIREAFNIVRIDNIVNVLKGRQKSALGFFWRYKPNEE